MKARQGPMPTDFGQNPNPAFYEWLAPWYESAYDWLDTAATVRQWCELLSLAAPRFLPRSSSRSQRPRLLDAGCGPAWHSVEWARAGFAVTAADSSPTMLRIAQSRINTVVPSIDSDPVHLISADLRCWKSAPSFDVVVGHTYLVHLFPPSELLSVAQTFHRLAAPDAVCLLEFGDLRHSSREGTRCFTDGDLRGMSIESEKTTDDTYTQHWHFRERGCVETFWFHSPSALESMFRRAGWRHVHTWFPSAKEQAPSWTRDHRSATRGVLVVSRS